MKKARHLARGGNRGRWSGAAALLTVGYNRALTRQGVRWPSQERQAGVYDCQWGLDRVRVVVAGELPLQPQNAPLHLFGAAPDRVGFGQGAYRRRSEETSLLLGQLFERFREEGFAMSYTMEDF